MSDTATQPHPETLELAQILHLENAAFARRHYGQMVVDWHGQSDMARRQMLSIAEAARQFAALHRVPAEAIDRPVPVPPFLTRLQQHAEVAILDRAGWIWIAVAFAAGHLL
jgi:hypothetical protein